MNIGHVFLYSLFLQRCTTCNPYIFTEINSNKSTTWPEKFLCNTLFIKEAQRGEISFSFLSCDTRWSLLSPNTPITIVCLLFTHYSISILLHPKETDATMKPRKIETPSYLYVVLVRVFFLCCYCY